MYLAFEAHKIIYEADGKMVPGLANRNGHRNHKDGNLQWGGKRERSFQTAEDTWLEPGARSVIEEKKLLTKSKSGNNHRPIKKRFKIAMTFNKLKMSLNKLKRDLNKIISNYIREK